MKHFSNIFIALLMFFSPSLLSAQKTIEIKLLDGKFVPPATTPKIPQEFKDKGARFVVKAGDIIKFCNTDKFVYKPFSFSKENRFEGLSGREGLKPGNCITIKAKNPGDKCIEFRLSEEIRANMQLIMVVLPANWPHEGEEKTPQASQSSFGTRVTNVDFSGIILGEWKRAAVKEAGFFQQHFRFPVEFLYVGDNAFNGRYGTITSTNYGKITSASYNVATSILLFSYVQSLDNKTGTAKLLLTENETHYYLTGTWKHDDGSGSGELMMEKWK